MNSPQHFSASLLEKASPGVGCFVLRRCNVSNSTLYSLELWLDSYQSHCTRLWLDLRWQAPCLFGSLVFRDPGTESLLLSLTQGFDSEPEAVQGFESWMLSLQDAKLKYHAARV